MIHTQFSNAVDYVVTDLALGRANVQFTNGYWYRYTNVSRRAILNLMLNHNMSLGFWVNENIVNNPRVQQQFDVKFAI